MSLLNDSQTGNKSHVEIEAEQRKVMEDIQNTLLQIEESVDDDETESETDEVSSASGI